MVRFSCFQAPIHTHKHKRTVQLFGETSENLPQYTSEEKNLRNLPHSEREDKPCLKDGEIPSNRIDHLSDSSPTERECKSEEMDLKHSSDSGSVHNNNAKMKKSQSLGSGLNRQNRTFTRDGSDDETDHGFSHNGSVDGFVPSCTNNHGPSLSDQLQDDIPSDSVLVGSDFTKNISVFSIGDRPKNENQNADKDDKQSSGDGTPCIRPLVVKSSSLPRMSSPYRCTSSFLPLSRSAEDLNVLDSRKKIMMHDEGERAHYQEREISESINGGNSGQNLADAEYGYNYVSSAKDWIIPLLDGANMEKVINGDTFSHRGEELPAKDFRLKRIEEWVNDLQHCDPLEEDTEPAPSADGALSKGNALVEESTALKIDAKENPGMEAAKRYISSLNASATAAQLTNLGLVVIPFLSAFVSLKALNLSGNAIVRISSGALPRGLHILNLSKNSISTIEGLRDLTRLRVLDLSYNRILRIGHGLASCSSLKELYLAGNKISEVEGLHRLLKLNVLDLRFNKISTTKCLGQLAANYSCLQALSLEGNPAQKNVGDEQLKKYVTSLLPHLTYYNRQSIKSGSLKDTTERSARLGIGAHQMDRGLQVEVKTLRKGSHGIVAQKVSSSSSNHARRSQTLTSTKPNRSSRHAFRPPTSGTKATFGHQFTDLSIKPRQGGISMARSRSEGNLGAL